MDEMFATKPYFVLNKIFSSLYCISLIVLRSNHYDHDSWLINRLTFLLFITLSEPIYPNPELHNA